MFDVKVTLAQIPQQNSLDNIKRIVAKNRKSHIIVFPEDTLKVGSLSIIDDIQVLSKKYDVAIVIGIIYKARKKMYDYAYYISKSKVRRYQKVHVHWTETHMPGKKFEVFKTPFGRIGLLMCYDAAYIESSLVLRRLGADIIIIISSIPASFKNEYFNLRLRAIAYFNQVFVIHCCRSGHKFSGHSSIVNPQGRVIKELGKHSKVSTKTINTKLIDEWRKTEKINICRRPKKYSCISE